MMDPTDPTDATNEELELEADANAFSPDAFDEFYKRHTAKASTGGKPAPLRRRYATAIVDPSLCLPGAFGAKFKLKMGSLNSNDEMKALQTGLDGQSVAYAMCKKAICEFNGRKLRKHEIDMLWEALGTAGRSAVTAVFMSHCTGADEQALGKSLASVEIE